MKGDNFSEFERMFAEGASPAELMARAIECGQLDVMERIRMIRTVCGLDLVEAKKIEHETRTGERLDAQQARIAEDLKAFFQDEGFEA